MNRKIEQRLINIAENASLRVLEGQGLRLLCLTGRVWITQENDARDIFLAAGESFTVDHSGLTVIGAVGEAAIVAFDPRGVRSTGRYRDVERQKLPPLPSICSRFARSSIIKT